MCEQEASPVRACAGSVDVRLFRAEGWVRVAGCRGVSGREKGRRFSREKPMRKRGVRSEMADSANQTEGYHCERWEAMGGPEWV